MAQKNSQQFKQGTADRRKYGASVIPQQLEIIRRLESGEN
jgi:hypothetical protein